MDIEVRTKNNGFVVQLDHDHHKEYVFKSTEILVMLEFIGRNILGKKVKVTEN